MYDVIFLILLSKNQILQFQMGILTLVGSEISKAFLGRPVHALNLQSWHRAAKFSKFVNEICASRYLKNAFPGFLC